MSDEDNVRLVERFYDEVINERRLEVIDELISDDFVHNGEHRGRVGQRAVYEAFLSSFPDLKSEVLEIFASGGKVAVHRRWTATHQGAFNGIAPTGRPVDFQSMAMITIRNGQIAEYHGVLDLFTAMQQIGGL